MMLHLWLQRIHHPSLRFCTSFERNDAILGDPSVGTIPTVFETQTQLRHQHILVILAANTRFRHTQEPLAGPVEEKSVQYRRLHCCFAAGPWARLLVPC